MVKAWLENARLNMRNQPYQYGWKIKGRIAAYCNEDAFIRVNALGVLLDEWAQQDLLIAEVRANFIRLGVDGFYGLALASFEQMTKETSRGEHNPIDKTAIRTIQTLLNAHVEVVVVSNSGTDRIVRLLRNADLPAESHHEHPTAALRVRGGAGKFLLGDASQSFSVGEYRIDTDRPAYLGILQEERPNTVIGDVFSLDLALPFSLAVRKSSGFENLTIWLRRRDYTPEWSAEFLSDKNLEVNGGILEGFDELLALGMGQ